MPTFSFAVSPISPTTMSKRKRDLDEEIAYKIQAHNQPLLTPYQHKPKPIRPLSPKRQRTTPSNHTLSHQIPANNPLTNQTSTTLPHQTSSPPTHHSTYTGDTIARPVLAPRAQTNTDLRACHICHRKPIKKRDLEGWVDCEGCGGRCCFVCVRVCLGPASDHDYDEPSSHNAGIKAKIRQEREEREARDMLRETNGMEELGAMEIDDCVRDDERRVRGPGCVDQMSGWRGGTHKRDVCSGCCVEVGEEGEVMCLGCLQMKQAA